MALTFYRDSAAGVALVDALDELVTSGRLQPDLAVKVLEEVSFSFLCLARPMANQGALAHTHTRASHHPPTLP